MKHWKSLLMSMWDVDTRNRMRGPGTRFKVLLRTLVWQGSQKPWSIHIQYIHYIYNMYAVYVCRIFPTTNWTGGWKSWVLPALHWFPTGSFKAKKTKLIWAGGANIFPHTTSICGISESAVIDLPTHHFPICMSCKTPYVYLHSFEDIACTTEIPGKVLSHFSGYRTWLQELAVKGLKMESLNTISIVLV